MNCHFRKRKRGKKIIAVVIMIFIAASAFWIYTNKKLDSLVKDVAVPQIKNKITETVNGAIEKIAAVYENDFVKITRDKNERIVSVETDQQKINLYRAAVTREIADRLSGLSDYYVYISLSNVYDDEIVLGNFPQLKIRANVEPNGGTETKAVSSLTSAGINQSLHKIELSVSVNVKVMLLISTVDVDVKTNVCIAETVIIGDVPEVFFGENVS